MIELIRGRLIHVDDTGNMIEIIDKPLTTLCKSMEIMFGDVTLDKNLIEPTEDIYDYIVEKIYSMPEYAYDISFETFKQNPKEKILIAFNKFFFDMIEKHENTGRYTD